MADLEILTQYQDILEEVNISLKGYNENLKNDLFEIEPNESHDEAYRRGETIYNQVDGNITNLNEILDQENEVIEFFKKCKENKQKLIEQKKRQLTERKECILC